MANFIPKLSTETNAQSTSNINAGQFIVTTDGHTLYVDVDGSTRVKVSDIITLPTYSDLMDIVYPLDKLYLVEENYTLYKAIDGEWHIIGGADTSGVPKKYTQTIGDGSNTLFNVIHNLNTTDVAVSAYNTVSGKNVWLDYTVVSQNQIQIQFTTAPTSNQLTVVVIG